MRPLYDAERTAALVSWRFVSEGAGVGGSELNVMSVLVLLDAGPAGTTRAVSDGPDANPGAFEEPVEAGGAPNDAVYPPDQPADMPNEFPSDQKVTVGEPLGIGGVVCTAPGRITVFVPGIDQLEDHAGDAAGGCAVAGATATESDATGKPSDSQFTSKSAIYMSDMLVKGMEGKCIPFMLP